MAFSCLDSQRFKEKEKFCRNYDWVVYDCDVSNYVLGLFYCKNISMGNSMNIIDNFHAAGYEFLSNFYPCKIVYKDYEFSSLEHAYQAAKTYKSSWNKFDGISAGQAKRLGKTLIIRTDWNDVRLSVMEELLRIKFTIPELKEKLKGTGDAELIESNTWGDYFYGVCRGRGKNHLGKLLMKIRAELYYNGKIISS